MKFLIVAILISLGTTSYAKDYLGDRQGTEMGIAVDMGTCSSDPVYSCMGKYAKDSELGANDSGSSSTGSGDSGSNQSIIESGTGH